MNTLMRRLTVSVALLGACLLAGCYTVSINPLYSRDVLVPHGELDPGLAGDWDEPDDTDPGFWEIVPIENNAYRLTIWAGDPKTPGEVAEDSRFLVHLLRLDGELYLDLYPDGPADISDNLRVHLIPVHTFLHVELTGDELTMRLLDSEWLKKRIKRGEVEIDHVMQEDVRVLTATTGELQELIRRHGKDLFDDLLTLRRLR